MTRDSIAASAEHAASSVCRVTGKREYFPVAVPLKSVLVYGLEVFLAYAAYRAYPVRRYVFEGGSGSYAGIRITCLGIVLPVAYCTSVFLHDSLIWINIGAKITLRWLIAKFILLTSRNNS